MLRQFNCLVKLPISIVDIAEFFLDALTFTPFMLSYCKHGVNPCLKNEVFI